MDISDQNSQQYARALGELITAGNQLLDWLPESREKRTFALDKLTQAVDGLNAQTLALKQGADSLEDPFLMAAAEMRAGYLLVEAGLAVESGERSGVEAAMSQLKAELEEVEAGDAGALFFESELLEPPPEAADDQQALQAFQARAIRTLDNMVIEARDVIAAAVDKFKDKFDSFADDLGGLAKSFASKEAGGVIRSGVEKIIVGLKAMAEFLKSDKLKEGIAYLKELVKNLALERALAAAFGCADAKETINGLTLAPSNNRKTMKDAGARMAELASRYVLLLKRARWVLKAIGVVGFFLTLTGVAAAHAALGAPIAYAVVALAIVLIGMSFVRSGMGDVIATVSPANP